MNTNDRAAALARVLSAIEEWRKVLDVLLRLKAVLEHDGDAGAVESVAEELRATRRSAGAAAREAQQRLEVVSSRVDERS